MNERFVKMLRPDNPQAANNEMTYTYRDSCFKKNEMME